MDVTTSSVAILADSASDVEAVLPDALARPDLADSGPLVQADQAWSVGYDGSGVAVGIVDTGVDATHPFLAGKVAAEIIEVRPNGNLYIEGNQTIQNNEEEWRIFISGEVDRQSISPDRTVSSKSIAKLDIHKQEVGQVRDGYARGWFNRWYDKYKPF